jgi:hypothetical protein
MIARAHRKHIKEIKYLHTMNYIQPGIQNMNIPSCRNCIHYQPSNNNSDFTSNFSTCAKYGKKDIITDKITFVYTDSCRMDESKCGIEGKYFEQEQNLQQKIIIHTIIHNSPYIITLLLPILSFIYVIQKY